MGLDKDFTGILRELIQFLECLREIKLPVTLENIRNNLLIRSRETLTTFTVMHRSNSPEAYLNMNAGLKGLLIAKPETELQEYVGAEDPKIAQKQQDYYETFLEIEAPSDASSKAPVEAGVKQEKEQDKKEAEQNPEKNQNNEHVKEEEAEGLIQIYSRLTAEQTKSTCVKHGPLCKKEGKKLFFTVFEQYRPYWVGLVGSHLLIYGSDRDSRPCLVQPIRGYMARAAPNALPRDPRKSESAFEVFRPGSRTLQFIARTPKDMEQWVARICQINESNENSKSNPPLSNSIVDHTTPRTETQENLVVHSEEQYQDVSSVSPSKFHSDEVFTKETEKKSKETTREIPDPVNPPPLPARIPRRLPSLPTTSTYKQAEEDEDDIYHKIEDFKDSSFYQNVMKSQKADAGKDNVFETYDDVHAAINANVKRKQQLKEAEISINVQPQPLVVQETYDDIGSVSKKANTSHTAEEQDQIISYDDIGSVSRNTESDKTQAPEKSEELQKTPQKKSFLDRVRSRKESPRKVEKKAKRKTPTPPPQTTEELPMYDDVSTLLNAVDNSQPAQTGSTSNAQEKQEEDLPLYTQPPPPRPIYSTPPAIPEAVDTQEIYDDVSSCLEKYKAEESKNKLDQQVLVQSGYNSNQAEDKQSVEQPFIEKTEHYQTPRSDACQQNHLYCQHQQEELYDDIAILADFTARQRSSLGKSEHEDTKYPGMPEKKPWNRFVGVRKSKPTDSLNSENSNPNGLDEVDEFSENQTLIRMNTFQKLINKMENSLGKTSGRTAPPVQLNRANLSSNT